MKTKINKRDDHSFNVENSKTGMFFEHFMGKISIEDARKK